MIIRAAFATDGGSLFNNRHFGDAGAYAIYEIDREGYRFLAQIENSSGEERGEVHADTEKARSVASLLLEQGVNTAVARIFGPNIKRIRRKFVCLLVDDIPIEAAADLLRENYDTIMTEWQKGAERSHIRLKKEQ
jgi:predicted Fe-Mo cluster-binding NifX family protein